MNLGDFFNNQFGLSIHLEFFLRVLIAGLFGAVIGFERTRRFKEAGIRTHVIVCTAAALMMIISKYGFTDMGAADSLVAGTRVADPARIAAQVVSGISFLCAGVIFKNGNTVKGLTTAAGIWATSGIGLAVGAGMYWLGLFVTVMVALLQFAMHRFTVGADSYTTSRITLRVKDGKRFQKPLQDQLKRWRATAVSIRMSRLEDDSTSFELTLRTPNEITPEEMIELSAQYPDILDVGISTIG